MTATVVPRKTTPMNQYQPRLMLRFSLLKNFKGLFAFLGTERKVTIKAKVLIAQSRTTILGIRNRSLSWDLEMKMITTIDAKLINPTAIDGRRRIWMAWAIPWSLSIILIKANDKFTGCASVCAILWNDWLCRFFINKLPDYCFQFLRTFSSLA